MEPAYRKGVGIVLLAENNTVLLFERLDRPGSWQFPQGGIDPGETPLQTAFRELTEETGLAATDVRYIGEYPDWLTYTYPPGRSYPDHTIGQTQRWFFMELLDPKRVHFELKQPHQEFSNFGRFTFVEATKVVVTFKRPVYEALLEFYQSTISSLRQ